LFGLPEESLQEQGMNLGFVYWKPGNKGRNWRTRVYVKDWGWWEWTWYTPWAALKDFWERSITK